MKAMRYLISDPERGSKYGDLILRQKLRELTSEAEDLGETPRWMEKVTRITPLGEEQGLLLLTHENQVKYIPVINHPYSPELIF